MSYLRVGDIHFNQHVSVSPPAPAARALSEKELLASVAAMVEARELAREAVAERQQRCGKEEQAVAEERRAIDRLTARVQRGRVRSRLSRLVPCFLVDKVRS